MAQEMPLKVVFCSRLHSRKRPDRFLDLASFAAAAGIDAIFEIYGSDQGELANLEDRIINDPDLLRVKYKGALQPDEVLQLLQRSDLLILPSENEPFPMIVLEALSVGTPVLVMSSCSISKMLAKDFPLMVTKSDDDRDLIEAFSILLSNLHRVGSRESIINVAKKLFNIEEVVNKIEREYIRLTSKQ